MKTKGNNFKIGLLLKSTQRFDTNEIFMQKNTEVSNLNHENGRVDGLKHIDR